MRFARDAIEAEQLVKLALHEASRVWARRTGERSALKKELDV